MSRRFPVVAIVVTISSAFLVAQDWTQWRGPGAAAVATAFKPPATWPDKLRMAWKVPSAGVGHSSPVVSGSRVHLFSRIGEQEALTAYELATGKQIWRQTYDAPYEVNPAARAHGKGPKSTPVVHGGRVFTFGIGGVLSAFDARDGRVIWRRDFKGQHASTSPEFGAAASPVAANDAIVLHVGGPNDGALTAFDPATGSVRWRWTGDGPAYATPIVAPLGGTSQLITQSQSSVVALDPAKGTVLWQIPFTTPYEQNIVTAVVHDGLVIYSGLSRPTTALRVRASGGKWVTEQVWSNPDVPMYMSSPVLASGRLCGLTHRNSGQFFCVDAASGKTLWTSDPRQGDNAGLFAAGDVFVAVTTGGTLIVFRSSASAFDVVARYTVADTPVWAHPVPAGRGVLIKDADSLAYWMVRRRPGG
jgi:outer membrane protein assembly factor BamB